MSFVRRSFVALTGLFLLQLTLLGSGTLCAVYHSVGRNNAGVDAMHDMGAMTSAATTRAAVPAAPDSHSPMSPADCGGTSQHDGCGLPWAPGQCSSMTACDISATPAASIMTSASGVAMSIELPTPALIHSGPTFAPDLPPPRA